MAVFGICMCKDEVDIIASTVGNMLGQVDEVLVADNGSTDGTREILAGLPVTLIDDLEVGYYQSRKMSALAARAATAGADWVVPFDADEWWYSPFGQIAEVLAGTLAAVVTAQLFDHVATGADGSDPDPVARIGWRRIQPGHLPKVACRAALPVTIEQGNHGASYPLAVVPGQLLIRHFPYRSPEQMARKARNGAAAYAATDLPTDIGAHWRQYGALLEAEGDEALGDVFRRWFWTADPARDPSLTFDPTPCPTSQ